LGDFGGNAIKVVDLTKVTGVHPAFHAGMAARETGQYGLWMKGDPSIWITGLADGVVLDRDKLGMNGRALYQADFYLPPEGEYLPSIAVLAMEPLPPGQVKPNSFYRFGITKNIFCYFSYVITEEETARIFQQDKAFIPKIPRPGWHRFAIVFEGVSKIRCYIDGHEPAFSPVEESSLRRLQVGIMLAEKDTTYEAYADNLSIQWTDEDVPIPDSPYAHTWSGGSSLPLQIANPTPVPVIQTATNASLPIEWLDPETAWQRAQQTNTPILVYFYAPRVKAAMTLDSIFQTDPAAQSFLKKYILVKFDVNQYHGGHLAKIYRIFKLPTIIIIDSQNNELARAIFSNVDTWQSFSSKFGVN
ncbi:hypothetical protein JW926_07990, partial [Candidatus Sumerlaeota bacterium]|nr:hypothetical protein [Candidatus Sumerlaeota bacterium]